MQFKLSPPGGMTLNAAINTNATTTQYWYAAPTSYTTVKTSAKITGVPPAAGPQPDNEILADMIDQVADTIERYGWIQGHFGQRATGFCLAGSARHVGDSRDHDALYWEHWVGEALLDTINQNPDRWGALPHGEKWHTIPAWNDSLGRTKQQVLDLCRYAAKRLRLVEVGLGE